MEMEERKSGLVAPKEKPLPPARQYGPTEIQNDERRAMAEQALSLLWDALDLSRGRPTIELPGVPTLVQYEAYWQLYHFIGEFLLGKDCPSKEQWT